MELLMEDDRLQRIEEKLDKLSDVIVGMARVEEKIEDLETRRSESHERVNRISARLDCIETGQASANAKLETIGKAVWFMVAGGLTVIGTQLAQLM